MSSVIPGVDGFPMGAATKLRGGDLCVVEKMVGDLAAPRRIAPRASRCSPNIRVSHVGLNVGHLFGVQHRSAVHVTSAPIGIYQVMVPLSGRLIGACETIAVPGFALIYTPKERLDTSWSDDCVALVLSVSPEKAAALARAAFPGLELDRVPARPLMRLSEGAGRSFANALGAICQESVDPASAFSRGVTARSLEESLLLSLLAQFTRDGDARLPAADAPGGKRRTYVGRAVDYIDAHRADDITLVDLIRVAGVSARTLQYGFTERFGVGPMTYLKRLRMQCVRDALRSAPPESCSVGNVAAQWGFYNGSAFARVYRRMFGELPSETLSRR
ncbi:MAG: helix-turn-helix domain-containing protein [Pseudochelatococcus sp.]|jgi:AraC-like DNA-binding protein|uniref:helix-turn-helix domain-containing protein n=1 Tax=Pseudochelatococcus sp. TaxID=2020869 RepID=UPI003D8AA58B